MSPSVEIAVRVGGSAVVFAIMALWEWFAPRRHLTAGRRPRWPGNPGILAVDIIAVRLLAPTAAVGVALIAAAHGWGLFNLLALPAWAALPLGVIALDLVIYGQHVVFHHVPALWRLHRMHHADLDIDVTTGVRFHPLEILLSLAIKMAAVAALGVPALAVLIFEVVLNATLMFQPQQCGVAAAAGPARTLDRGNAADASGASLNRARGNRQQFRIQSAVVGSSVRDLSRQTGGRRARHDDRPADLSRRGGIAHQASFDAAVSQSHLVTHDLFRMRAG
jgi:hypothetical protein